MTAAPARKPTLARACRTAVCGSLGIAVMLLGGVHPAGAATAPVGTSAPVGTAQSAAAPTGTTGTPAAGTPIPAGATARAEPSSVLSGVVKDGHARLVAGASFVLSQGETTIAEAVTAADGAFAFTRLAAGKYQVKITPPAGSAYGVLTQTITIATDGEQRTGMVFTLPVAPGTTPQPAPTPPPPTAGAPNFPITTIGRVTPLLAPTLAVRKNAKVRVNSAGRLTLPVACKRRARCAATISLLIPAKKKSKKADSDDPASATTKFSAIGSGRIDTKAAKSKVTPQLTLAGRKRLKAAGKLKVTVRVSPKNPNAPIRELRITLSTK